MTNVSRQKRKKKKNKGTKCLEIRWSHFLLICILSCWISGFNVTYPLFCGSELRLAVNSNGLKSRNKSQTDTELVAFVLLHRMRWFLFTVISNTCLPAQSNHFQWSPEGCRSHTVLTGPLIIPHMAGSLFF